MTTTGVRHLLVCAALLAASCRGTPTWARTAEPTHVTATVAIPTSWNLGLPIVEVSIDGHGPFRFILDSGASCLFIDRRAADELRLERVDVTGDEAARGIDSGEGAFSVRQAARIREFRAGPLVDRDGQALVVDLSPMERAAGGRIDGAVPAGMFRGGLLTLDHGAGDATFGPGELPAPDGREVVAIDYDDRCFVSIPIGGRRCPVLLDTGSRYFLSLPASLESSLRFRAPPAVVGRLATLAGIAPLRAGRIDGTLMWGASRIADPVVGLSAADFGNAGMAFLREFRVTFDFTNRLVRFERTGAEPIRCPPVRSPGAGFLREEGVWAVAYLLDGGPAERAGLRVGDRVAAIDGRPVSDVGRVEYEKMLATRERMTLRVLRDGAARDVVVEIATLVE
jgi:membrane-associated protease RseP (regulator of RpoE activity)